MYYRLIEDHKVYGYMGLVITRQEYLDVPYTNKALFEPRQDDDPVYCHVSIAVPGKLYVDLIADNSRELDILCGKIIDCKKYSHRLLGRSIAAEKDFTVTEENGNKTFIKFNCTFNINKQNEQ